MQNRICLSVMEILLEIVDLPPKIGLFYQLNVCILDVTSSYSHWSAVIDKYSNFCKQLLIEPVSFQIKQSLKVGSLAGKIIRF